jgi:N-glycosylase/DNA lyase
LERVKNPFQGIFFMQTLVQRVKALRQGPVKGLVEARLAEFKALGRKGSGELFKELCFCTMTANFDAEKSIAIQERVCSGFLRLPEKRLEEKLRSLGYRYPNRASYMCENRAFAKGLSVALEGISGERQKREWLAANVKGLGFKEASHFLRNIGFENLAIIDFHIVDLLEREGLIERPKTMTKKRYLEIEAVLEGLAKRLGMSLAELDLYLWYLETGKVLK